MPRPNTVKRRRGHRCPRALMSMIAVAMALGSMAMALGDGVHDRSSCQDMQACSSTVGSLNRVCMPGDFVAMAEQPPMTTMDQHMLEMVASTPSPKKALVTKPRTGKKTKKKRRAAPCDSGVDVPQETDPDRPFPPQTGPDRPFPPGTGPDRLIS